MKLEHLAPYLPYSLKIVHGTNSFGWNILSPSHLAMINLFSEYWKPVLRPLSDLTKEIEHGGESFVPIDKLRYYKFPGFVDLVYNGCSQDTTYWHFTKLIEWHFDVFGLIEKGEAVDINTVDPFEDLDLLFSKKL